MLSWKLIKQRFRKQLDAMFRVEDEALVIFNKIIPWNKWGLPNT